MARIPRRLVARPGFSVHKIWRGHNKEFNLSHPSWKLAYLTFMNIELEKLEEAAPPLYALTLMDNHVHELFKVLSQITFSNFMRSHHGRYGRYFNDENNRSGKVAEDRPKTCLLENDYVEREVTLYIHANPFRSRMERKRAVNYRWSTHRLYAFGKREEWMRHVSFPNWYMKLGRNMENRQRAYRRMFARYLRRYGMEYQPLFSRHFVGNPIWAQEKLDEVNELMRELYPRRPP